MLTHTDVHYLAAILTQIASPWGVEIELGEMVEDIAADKARDVDITVRYQLPNGTLAEMHGIEVKNEKRPLDAVHVEQIIIKLKDMPSLTARALVSSSGFTESAKKKARYHGLDLYHLKDWDGKGLPVDMSQTIFGGIEILEWESVKPIPIIDELSPNDFHEQQRFEFGPNLMIHDPANPDLKRGFGELLDSVCNQVLDVVASEIRNNPDIKNERRFIVNKPMHFNIPFQIPVNGEMVTIPTIMIEGIAVLKEYPSQHTFKALIKDEDNSPIAGCMINELPDGGLSLFMTTSTEGSLAARFISVSDRGNKRIYKKKLTPISLEGFVPISNNKN